jgi:hypothetical protein
MSTNTTNYNLVKPGLNETADIEVINQNMDIIDSGLKNVSDKADGKISKSLATAANQFLLSSAVGQFVVKTVDEIKSLLGLKGAAEKDFNTAGGVASYDAVQSHLSDYVRQPGYAVATGSANTYAVTLSPAPTSYIDGMGIVVKINVANTGAATINVNGLGAKPMVDGKGSALTAGKLRLNGTYSLKYNTTSGNFILQGEGGEIPKLPNLVKNGSFENDFNCWGWNLVSISTGKIYSGTKSVIFNNNGSQYCYMFQDITMPGGHKVYMTCMVYLTSCAGVNGFYITPSNPEGTESYGAVYVNPTLLNQWQRISMIANLPAGNTKVRLRIYSYNTIASGYVDSIMAIDLTDAYGVGNEPTKEEMNVNVGTFTNMIRNGNCEEGVGSWLNSDPARTTFSVENGRFKISSTSTTRYVRQYVKVKPNTDYYISGNVSGVGGVLYVFDSNIATILKTGVGTFNSGINSEIAILLHSGSVDTNIAYFDSIMIIEGTTAPVAYRSYMKYDWWDSDLPLLISDADAVSRDILSNKIAYASGWRLAGSIPNRTLEAVGGPTWVEEVKAYNDGTLTLRPKEGYYKSEVNGSGYGSIAATDPNFIAANIVSGKSIFGLVGSFSGKRWTKGTIVYTSPEAVPFTDLNGSTGTWFYPFTISGLTFKPTKIVLKTIVSGQAYYSTYEEGSDQIDYQVDYPKVVRITKYYNGFNNNVNYSIKGDVAPVSITSTGFTLPVATGATHTYVWEAYE